MADPVPILAIVLGVIGLFKHTSANRLTSQETTYGLHLLYDGSNDPEAPEDASDLDIFAFGEAMQSWKHSNDCDWLQSLLPTDFPRSRIYRFNCGSPALLSRSNESLFEHSTVFLEEFKLVRRGLNKHRPILFIAHGYGGLVAKNAYVLAMNDYDICLDFASRLRGWIFLATPHHGIAIAPLAYILAQVIKFVIPGQGCAPKDFLKLLRAGNARLESLHEEFLNFAHNHPPQPHWILSFYATRNSSGRVILKETCTVGLPGEVLTPIPFANSANLGKFSSASSYGYRRISGFIQDCISYKDGKSPDGITAATLARFGPHITERDSESELNGDNIPVGGTSTGPTYITDGSSTLNPNIHINHVSFGNGGTLMLGTPLTEGHESRPGSLAAWSKFQGALSLVPESCGDIIMPTAQSTARLLAESSQPINTVPPIWIQELALATAAGVGVAGTGVGIANAHSNRINARAAERSATAAEVTAKVTEERFLFDKNTANAASTSGFDPIEHESELELTRKLAGSSKQFPKLRTETEEKDKSVEIKQKLYQKQERRLRERKQNVETAQKTLRGNRARNNLEEGLAVRLGKIVQGFFPSERKSQKSGHPKSTIGIDKGKGKAPIKIEEPDLPSPFEPHSRSTKPNAENRKKGIQVESQDPNNGIIEDTPRAAESSHTALSPSIRSVESSVAPDRDMYKLRSLHKSNKVVETKAGPSSPDYHATRTEPSGVVTDSGVAPLNETTPITSNDGAEEGSVAAAVTAPDTGNTEEREEESGRK